MIPTNTIYKERQLFIARIKSNPFFLLRHLRSLSTMLWSRYRTKAFAIFRGTHKGCKIRPHWLKKLKKLDGSRISNFHAQLLQSPRRQQIPKHHEIDNHHNSFNHDTQDPEDYFAKNRWEEIITQIMHETSVKPSFQLPQTIISWLEHTPKKNDPAWETYSTCERVANLVTWLSFIPPDKHNPDDLKNIADILSDSIQWIDDHLEYYGENTGNHILNNARALIMGGALLNHEDAVKTGLTILHHMIPVLIQPQGALRERSSHYQLIVLTWLLDCYTYAKHYLSLEDVNLLSSTIERMKKVAALFCDASGFLRSFIGDISPDRTPTQTVLRLKACYPADWPVQTIPSQPYCRYDDWHLLSTEQTRVIINFPCGCYPQSHPTHAHGDLLSFVWLYKDKPVLIDAGRSRYTKDAISVLQKSALGHNSPLVNQMAPLCESFVLTGNWWPLPYAQANLSSVYHDDNTLHLSHDGFKRATPVKNHTRTFSLKKDCLQICDRFEGTGPATIHLLWQLHPSFDQFDQATSMINSDTMGLHMHIKEIERTAKIEYHQAAPVQKNIKSEPHRGWYSSQYGTAEQHPILSLHWNVNLPFTATIEFTVRPCVV